MKLLFRRDQGNHDEYLAAREVFGDTLYTTRAAIPPLSIVLGRYSVLPYYKELETDLEHNKSVLINTHQEHEYIAQATWYFDLLEHTPRTWFALDAFIAEAGEGQYVVKGRTNSRKFEWNTHMFAATKKRAIEIYCELLGDQLIFPQGIMIREFEAFETFEIGLNEMPMINEWRFFFLEHKLITGGFYWSILDDKSVVKSEDRKAAEEMACYIANKIRGRVMFFAIDVAKRVDGVWRVIELNDGQMSGLSDIEPLEFYRALKVQIG